jgi:hypothetical protein
MCELRYTLVTEGSSDAALMPILHWLLKENGVDGAIQGEWADLGEAAIQERISLSVKIREAVRLYPCDFLFVHRDADRASLEHRRSEIESAVSDALGSRSKLPHVCVIPVRMQEAWLLFDETAIRHAAGNKNGQEPLNLPPLHRLETIPDPKQRLHEVLRTASGLSGRRLRRFRPNRIARRVSEFTDDFAPLRMLPAFAVLEEDVRNAVRDHYS